MLIQAKKSNSPHKRPDVPLIGSLQVLVVHVAVLLGDDDRRVARLHEQQVHQQAGRPPVAIHERVDMD